jgi:hypothetical protein
MLFRPAFTTASAGRAPTGTLNLTRDGRTVGAWVSSVSGQPVPTLTLTQFDAATVDKISEVTGSGTLASPWVWRASGLGSVLVEVESHPVFFNENLDVFVVLRQVFSKN